MLQISFEEVQTHGDFDVYFSAANDMGFMLLGSVPNPGGGMIAGVVMTTVTLPSTPCAACTLQLVHKNGGDVNNWYYSCANIVLGAGGSSSTTTTTTQPSGSSSTTTTTLAVPADPCEEMDGLDAAGCRVDVALDEPLCDEEVVDPKLHDAVVAAMRKMQSLVELAKTKTKPTQVARLLRKADRKLAKIVLKAGRAANARKISDSCEGAIGLVIEELRYALTDALAGA